MTVDADAIPAVLRDYPQWVCWRAQERNGKQTKIPIDPQTRSFASVSDPETWTYFELAVGVASVEDGLGFVFTDDDPFLGVDLDDCRKHGELTDWASDIVDRLDSYTEVSPSGEGVHVLIEGEIPSTKSRSGSVECYDSARFFTMTGDRVNGTPSGIESCQDAFAAVYDQYVYSDTDPTEQKQTPDESASTSSITLSDRELVEKATSAKNGQKFASLWKGNTTGYESQSEADMALSCLLAFWTGKDESRIDRLFRDSGLYRDKWDEVHYADGSTYGEQTVTRAVRITSETYDGDSDTSSKESVEAIDSGTQAQSAEGNVLQERVTVLSDRVSSLERQLTDLRDQIDEQTKDERTTSGKAISAEAGIPREPEPDHPASTLARFQRLFK